MVKSLLRKVLGQSKEHLHYDLHDDLTSGFSVLEFWTTSTHDQFFGSVAGAVTLTKDELRVLVDAIQCRHLPPAIGSEIIGDGFSCLPINLFYFYLFLVYMEVLVAGHCHSSFP